MHAGNFDQIAKCLEIMQLADSFGQVSRLAFSRFERNAKLDAQLFRFVPPAGADVLEER